MVSVSFVAPTVFIVNVKSPFGPAKAVKLSPEAALILVARSATDVAKSVLCSTNIVPEPAVPVAMSSRTPFVKAST